MQDVAELPAAEYVPAPQSTHVADEPEPETIFPAAVQPHDKIVPTPAHEKPVFASQVVAPDVEPEPSGQVVQPATLLSIAYPDGLAVLDGQLVRAGGLVTDTVDEQVVMLT